jgi:amidohydrolase
MCFAMHLWNEQPVGWLGITAGSVMSASDVFRVRVIGKGGHAAAPHYSIDPVLTSAQIINTLQSVVARNVRPLDSAVVTVTSVHGGEAFNVIPPEVYLKGTIRTFDPLVRDQILIRFREIVTGIAESMGCQVKIDTRKITPPIVNDHDMTQQVFNVANQILPKSRIDTSSRTMGSEDMAYLMEEIPGCYFFVGSSNAEKGLDAVHHHPKFDFDESVLPNAAALMAATISSFLHKEHDY